MFFQTAYTLIGAGSGRHAPMMPSLSLGADSPLDYCQARLLEVSIGQQAAEQRELLSTDASVSCGGKVNRRIRSAIERIQHAGAPSPCESSPATWELGVGVLTLER
jgi:hypothetical protein